MVDLYELGLLVKDIDNFNMDDFNGRLRFQKTIQLLQSFGIYMGYDFNWYLRGPYCTDLTKDGFALKDVMDRIPNISVEFAEPEGQFIYENFKRFISNKKNDADKLEIASTIAFLYRDEGMNKSEILRLTEQKQSHFTMEKCKQIWNELEKYGVVKS